MKYIYNILIVCFISSILMSCSLGSFSIEKRRYRKGYSIDIASRTIKNDNRDREIKTDVDRLSDKIEIQKISSINLTTENIAKKNILNGSKIEVEDNLTKTHKNSSDKNIPLAVFVKKTMHLALKGLTRVFVKHTASKALRRSGPSLYLEAPIFIFIGIGAIFILVAIFALGEAAIGIAGIIVFCILGGGLILAGLIWLISAIADYNKSKQDLIIKNTPNKTPDDLH